MINLQLITLSGAKLQEDVFEVVLPTADGAIAVFEQHMPIVTVAVPGVITVRRKSTDSDDELELFATNGGVIEVTGKQVRVLADEADSAEGISEDEAKVALERAQKLRAAATDKTSIEHSQSLVDRQVVRLKVAELHRTHRKRSHR
jgi:F-type H+-transporting ATPase subunit epsilon